MSDVASGPITLVYGNDPSQFGQLWLPAGDAAAPVAILIHGGFWRSTYGLDLMDPMAGDLVARGFAVWNIEYRRVGQQGGGYPGTLDDVAAAIDLLAEVPATNDLDPSRLDLSRVSVIGHSAGGQLALWSAGRSDAAVVPQVAIGLGAVANLELGAAEGLGGGAVIDFLGGTPADVPDAYAAAAPLPSVDGVSMVSVRASGDDIVPTEFTVPSGTHAYELVDIPGDHFTLIDPAAESWSGVVLPLLLE